MPEPDCFLRYRICAARRNFTSRKSDVYVFAAAASRGFKMVLRPARCSDALLYNVEPSKQLCRRYMHSTECPSSWYISWCWCVLHQSLLPVISTVWQDELSAVWQLDMSAIWYWGCLRLVCYFVYNNNNNSNNNRIYIAPWCHEDIEALFINTAACSVCRSLFQV